MATAKETALAKFKINVNEEASRVLGFVIPLPCVLDWQGNANSWANYERARRLTDAMYLAKD